MIPLAQAIAAAQSIHKLGAIYPSAAKIKQARLALEAAAKAKGKRPPRKPKSTFKADTSVGGW